MAITLLSVGFRGCPSRLDGCYAVQWYYSPQSKWFWHLMNFPGNKVGCQFITYKACTLTIFSFLAVLLYINIHFITNLRQT